MNIFEELKPQIEAFKDARDNVISVASLLPTNGVESCGEPPFAVDDGTNYYAVIDKNGEVKPLPFGYQVASDDMVMDGVDVILSTPMSIAGRGASIVRYVPLVKDFEVPGSRAFCLETTEDSEAWAAVGQTVDALQKILSERALFNFNQRLSNAISRVYEGCDEVESVDQVITAFFMRSTFLPTLFLRSCRHALEKLEEELNDGEDDVEE